MQPKKAVIALSGGLDSATVLAYLCREGFDVTCYGFYYGAKHNHFELTQAQRLADYYKCHFTTIDLSGTMGHFKSDLLLSGKAIPEGHYTDKTMASTVVPCRNMIFLSVLAGLAESNGAEIVGIGIHQGDHAIYPDCRPEFFAAMNTAVIASTDGGVSLLAPFIGKDKGGIVRWGLDYQVPYHMTRTCYKHQATACGKCGSCIERLEAFDKNAQVDPIEYEEQT